MGRRRLSKLSSPEVAALCVVALVTGSCGPTFDELERTREVERQQAIAASEQSLAAFAKGHNAVAVDIFSLDPIPDRFTAQLQEQLEGKTVAFRSGLRDVVRVSQNEYQLVLGNPLIGGTVATLTADQEIAAELLTQPADPYAEFLVVAHIERVAPLILELSSGPEEEDRKVELEPNLPGNSHHISGRVIVIEQEP